MKRHGEMLTHMVEGAEYIPDMSWIVLTVHSEVSGLIAVVIDCGHRRAKR